MVVLYPRLCSKLIVVVLPELGPPVITYQLVLMPSFSISIFVLALIVAVAMSATSEQVHKQTAKQENKWEKRGEMLAMVDHEIQPHDHD